MLVLVMLYFFVITPVLVYAMLQYSTCAFYVKGAVQFLWMMIMMIIVFHDVDNSRLNKLSPVFGKLLKTIPFSHSCVPV